MLEQAGLLTRLAIDVVCVILLVRGVYYRKYRRANLFLTFFSFNLVIFLITYLLNAVEISLGAAFGLFAVFSMLRYRTEGISTRDMTYLFLVIALGLLMAVAPASPGELLLVGLLLPGTARLLEGKRMAPRELRQRILYDNVELAAAHRRDELLQDLRERTGLPIHRVEVRAVNYVRDSARIMAYYYPAEGER
ncbi:MAG: DUF4956 domain-containing protein [Gemmatimonadota bacterium]